MILSHLVIFFFFNDTATTEIYTLSLHDALPIYAGARPVILSDAAQKILRGQLEAHRSEWVFPNPDGRPYDRSYIGRAFRKAARAAGLRDFRFHDLRHHGATMALNKGFTAPIVMALGGWKTERMMRRYAAVTDVTLRAAAEAVTGAQMQPCEQPVRASPNPKITGACTG